MSDSSNKQTYYELLDIAKDASDEEVLAAYHNAKVTYSPDSPALCSMFSAEEAKQINILIDEAYYTLSNSERRHSYDQSLSNSGFEIFIEKNNKNKVESLKKDKTSQDIKKEEEERLLNNGIGLTRFSKYNIDEIIENEIIEQEVFDGSFLKKIREYKNISLENLSATFKIAKHHYIAIEENDFKSLPATIFVKNYVKQYAEVLNLDAKKVSDSYAKILKEVREEK